MPDKVYYSKNSKKRKNILVEYVLEKYGSMNNFLKKFEEISDIGCKREKIENAIVKPDFLEKMQIGTKICDVLHIDCWELFGNENICVLESAENSDAEETPEEQFLLLNFEARQKTIEYMREILKIEK